MRIKTLSIENFKGIASLTVSFYGNSSTISGANATGKSTIRDSFLWLLFGKDGQGRADFAVKPRDASGNERHNLITAVEATMDEGDRAFTLRRELKENWVKRRGSTEREFQGNETAYSIDGVPLKKKDFDAAVSDLADETLFRVLTDTRYFCEMMDWKERRKVLAVVAGIDTVRLAALDSDRQRVQASIKKLREEADAIPVRIDEARRAVFPVSATTEALNEEIDRVQKRRAEIKTRIGDLAGGGASSTLRLDLDEIESRIKAVTAEQDAANRKAVAEYREEIDAATRRAKEAAAQAAATRRELDRLTREQAALTDDLNRIGKQYDERAASQWAGTTTCPTCKQSLPDGDIEAARKKFNAERAAELKRLDERGREIDKALEDIEKQIDTTKATLDAETATATTLAAVAERAAAAIAPAVVEDERLPVLRGNAEKLRQALSSEENSRKAQVAPLEDEDKRLDIEERSARATIATIEANKSAEKRVAELVAYQQTIGQTYADAERELIEIENETRSTAAEIEAAVAERFSGVRFRLFDEQINGGLRETCEPMIDGVPYGSANNAARINAGIKIIDAIGRYHGKKFPVFVDNAEAVNIIEETETQTIQLVVTRDNDLFMHLRDDWSPIEWEYMKDTLSTVLRMTLPMVETMAGVFTARFGSRFADYAFLEKLCIIDAAWVEATRGEKVEKLTIEGGRIHE